jgi:mRNA interferase RelE/StbE
MYTIGLKKSAQKQIQKLPKSISGRFIEVVELYLLENPFSPVLDIKKLKTPFPGYRLRIQEYRFLFVIDEILKEITFYECAHRKDAYKK